MTTIITENTENTEKPTITLRGISNVVQLKDRFMVLLFYDIDREIVSQEEIDELDSICYINRLAHILYKTKHGYHFISFTPLEPDRWGILFMKLTAMFGGYYGGHTIRMSLKPNAKQRLIRLETTYGEVIPNLFNVYARRFNLNEY